ncbi:hypothetical protein L3V82_04365 [Thiotrichales bacterium 19S3-7]|nr:hypothetical protein [Thiotrichales bacterium 19S3-7]MCF6801328.1 hypothetical protein [Thiotrichales bacterium 19S3-11]
MSILYKNIALVKEVESPENPQALEKRVALTPNDVAKLIDFGVNVYVEAGAGERVGFSDDAYKQFGAVIENHHKIYQNKDMIVKFKGPSLESIDRMKAGCTLFCMAHFHSYPERANKLRENKINVIAMEEILQSPKAESNDETLSRVAMNTFLMPYIESNSMHEVDLYVIQWTKRLKGAIRRASNRNPKSLAILSDNFKISQIPSINTNNLVFYDSQTFNQPQQRELIDQLKHTQAKLFDLSEFEINEGAAKVSEYRQSHQPFLLGKRRIECLHQTGQAGARYGLTLLKQHRAKSIDSVKAIVLGYGNVAQGAIDELYQNGVKTIHVLGKVHTQKDHIEKWLQDADLIINGAEQAYELRGKNYLISNQHIKQSIKNDAVIIDLIGGSSTNRSPVEAVINCNFLTDPYFQQDNVKISSIWGWPMMGLEKESTIQYSHQIVDVLLGKEKLIYGINNNEKGLSRALICGPFTMAKENAYS